MRIALLFHNMEQCGLKLCVNIIFQKDKIGQEIWIAVSGYFSALG